MTLPFGRVVRASVEQTMRRAVFLSIDRVVGPIFAVKTFGDLGIPVLNGLLLTYSLRYALIDRRDIVVGYS